MRSHRVICGRLDTDKREFVEGLSDAMLTWDSGLEYLRPITAKVRAGDFASAEDVRHAVGEAMRAKFEQDRMTPN
ncbi:MAG: hypothetical protein L0Y44_11880 [Phycisphaerales bacterium]|nr:hypothetical protein [Phycisphaerales bacterium]MCI0631338.1 hypothetical protein [Phycisphaerales bacterium]MCI0675114.1 hypothetical protein [Phycisphaerales bacterium]